MFFAHPSPGHSGDTSETLHNIDTDTPTNTEALKMENVRRKFDAPSVVRPAAKRLGRPKSVVDTSGVADLRSQGLGWKRIAAELGIGVGTLYRLSLHGSQIQERVI